MYTTTKPLLVHPQTSIAAALAYESYIARLHQLLVDVVVTTKSNQELSAEDGNSKAMEIILAAREASRKVIIVGNGGSAAIASHQALDLWNAAGINALAFNDAALLTCLSNDYGYENVFSQAIERFAQPGDVLVAISSSGRSQNILNAVRAARAAACAVITYAGFSKDAPLRSAGDLNFFIDSNQYGLVEVAHQALVHFLTDKLAEQRQGVK